MAQIERDPKKVGPGFWIALHVLAYNSTTLELQQSYCKSVRAMCSGFPCPVCRGHAMEFIEDNPPEKYIKANDPRAMFRWSSAGLHNNANKIKNRPMHNWEDEYAKYAKNSPICADNCGEYDNLKQKKVKITSRQKTSYQMKIKANEN